LVVHVGGLRAGKFEGIHWHADPAVRIRYLADPARAAVSKIEVTRPDGAVTLYAAREAAAKTNAAPGSEGDWRVMDCIDCHNRPAHPSPTREAEVDAAISAGRIDRDLPFIRREAVKALAAVYPDRDAARRGVASSLRAFYE